MTSAGSMWRRYMARGVLYPGVSRGEGDMRIMLALVVSVVSALVPGAARGRVQETPPGSGPLREGVAVDCLVASARGEMESALPLCREAVKQGAEDVRILEALAESEYHVGDPARAAELYRRLETEHGWRWTWALGLARSYWRDGSPGDAEGVLRDAVQRDPSVAPRRELVAFLLGYSRWAEAATEARAALKLFPGECSLHEDLGVAEAGLQRDGEAARQIGMALSLGCSPLRWTRRGEIPTRIHRPEYRKLLDPRVLSKDLVHLDEGDALARLKLLGLVLRPDEGPVLARTALESSSAPVKLACLHLLVRLGGSVADQWRLVLGSEDLMLRKHALRMLAREADPGLLPVLEEHLDVERAPHNLSLTRVAVARLLIDAGQGDRALTLLQEIPADDPGWPMAKELLDRAGGGAS